MKKILTILGLAAFVALFGLTSTVEAQAYNPNSYGQYPQQYQYQYGNPGMPSYNYGYGYGNAYAKPIAQTPIFPQGYAGYYCPAGYVLTTRNGAFTCMSTTASYPYDRDNDDDDDNDEDAVLVIDDSNDTQDDDITVYEHEISGWKEIFSFELSAEGEDVEIERLPITIEFDDAEYDDVIYDIKLEVDNDDYTRVSVDSDDEEAVVTFRTDNLEIDEDDTVTATVWVRFERASGNYDDGETIRAYIDEDNIEDIETDNNLDEDEIDGSAEGEEIELDVRD